MPVDLGSCRVRRLGRIEYPDALRMQEGMVRLRREGKIPDTLNGHLDLRYPLLPNYSILLNP